MKPEPKAAIGIIGGSGTYKMEGVEIEDEILVETPFGATSDTISLGRMMGRRVAFLPRHGHLHHLMPSEVPHRANIWALKTLGVRWIIGLSAVGSLKELIRPGDMVIPLQYFDRGRTTHEPASFFGRGIVAHVSFGQPVCEKLATTLFQAAGSLGDVNVHWGGTYVNIQGPAFSTRSESLFYRQCGWDVIGMTSLPEAKLAREAEISYALVAMVTDFDCWYHEHGEVNASDVVATLKECGSHAQQTIARAIASINEDEFTPCHSALENAFITKRKDWTEERIYELRPILQRFL